MNSKLTKFFLACAMLFLAFSVVSAQKSNKDKKDKVDIPDEPETVRTIAADNGVVITVCLESGNILVIGGESREVRVTAEDASRVTLRPTDGAIASGPATRLEIVVADSHKSDRPHFGECRGTSNMDIEVPRGATLYVATRDGDIEISNVAEVRADASIGNISLQRIAKVVEATTVSGDISLEESNGRIRLRSISGSIEAIKAKVVEENDFLSANTISGDVMLEQIAQPRVEVSTITGEISLSGTLAQGGYYDFKTTTGDITIAMPATVTFEVTARVSQSGEVITDFPLKYAAGMSTRDVMSSGKLAGIYGTGASPAKLSLVSFSGTLHLRRK